MRLVEVFLSFLVRCPTIRLRTMIHSVQVTDDNWVLVGDLACPGEISIGVFWRMLYCGDDDLAQCSLLDADNEGEIDSQEWASIAEPELDDEFVHIQASPLVVWRLCAHRYPIATRILLWTWLLALLLGELGTTIWWLRSLDAGGLWHLMPLACLSFALAFCLLRPMQVVATIASLLLATLPALPSYSAVSLLIPIDDQKTDSAVSWQLLHATAIMALIVMHLVAAAIPVLQSEASQMAAFVESAWFVARKICLAVVLVYAMATILPMMSGATAAGQLEHSSPLSTTRGLVLSLHLLGVMCGAARQHTMTSLGDDFLPCLLGVKRARALSFRALVARFGRKALLKALRYLPSLRLCAPPNSIAAFVVAVRRTAPVLLPLLALAPHYCVHADWLTRFALASACLALSIVICLLTLQELDSMPISRLRRLPFLLPNMTSHKRACLGNALVFAVRLADAYSFVSYPFAMLPW